MNIEFKERIVLIEMEDQVKEAIEWGKSQGGCKPATPASGKLFECMEDSTPLSKDEADHFHSVVQKLLYNLTESDIDGGMYTYVPDHGIIT